MHLPFLHPFSNTVIDTETGEEREIAELATSASGSGSSGGSSVLSALLATAGGDSSGAGVGDTAVIAPRYGLRVVSWNLQDLGGGPSRGPERGATVIARIARILIECDADVCVILEVKRRLWLPPRPVEPTPAPRTRKRKSAEVLGAEFERRKADYVKKMEEWEARRAEAQKTTPKTAPGVLELERIVAAMNALAGDGTYARLTPEADMKPEEVFTEGETYGFIVRASMFSAGTFELLNRTPDGDPIHWPEAGYRAPARARLRFRGADRSVDIVAFHAPAPSHGEITHAAIKVFSSMKWEVDTIVAGDFNVDTEAGSRSASDEALDTLLAFVEGGNCEYCATISGKISIVSSSVVNEPATLSGSFLGWFTRPEEADGVEGDLVFEGDFKGFMTMGGSTQEAKMSGATFLFNDVRLQPIESPHGHGDEATYVAALRHTHVAALKADHDADDDEDEEERLHGWLSGALLPAGEREMWSAAADTGRTSLRRQVTTQTFDPFNRRTGMYYAPDDFNNAGYDKLFVLPVTPKPSLRPIEGWAYPLVERCLPERLEVAFEGFDIFDPVANGDRWGTITDEGHRTHLARIARLAGELEELRQSRIVEDDGDGGVEEGGGGAGVSSGGDGTAMLSVPAFTGLVSTSPSSLASLWPAMTASIEAPPRDDDEESFHPGDDEVEMEEEPDEEQEALCAAAATSIGVLERLMQTVLDAANQISDHVPMILDIELL